MCMFVLQCCNTQVWCPAKQWLRCAVHMLWLSGWRCVGMTTTCVAEIASHFVTSSRAQTLLLVTKWEAIIAEYIAHVVCFSPCIPPCSSARYESRHARVLDMNPALLECSIWIPPCLSARYESEIDPLSCELAKHQNPTKRSIPDVDIWNLDTSKRA